MTIIYIHGVTVRDRGHGERLKDSFDRWLGPKVGMSGLPAYEPVFWGDLAADFRWKLASRPPTSLLAAGAPGGGAFAGLGSLREAGPRSPLDARPAGVPVTGPVLGAPGPAAPAAPPAPPLAAVPVGKRPDFLVDLYLATRALRDRGAPGATRVPDPLAEDPTAAPLAATAAAVAARWDAIVAKDDTDAKRAARLVQEVDAALTGDGLLQMGAIADWMTRAGETLRRAGTFPGDAISTVFAELRPAINNLVAAFIGDVLVYLETRGTAGQPGPIQVRVLDALKTAQAHKTATGERIVVVTHSMGGQLLYDALTHFAPADPALAGLVVDHWISCGAQVSYFAEVGVFRGQPGTRAPQKLPRPASVAAWTNYYDRNDLVGFVMAPVFDGVTDIEYDTGYGLAFAHTGYLGRPSFFEAVAARIGG